MADSMVQNLQNLHVRRASWSFLYKNLPFSSALLRDRELGINATRMWDSFIRLTPQIAPSSSSQWYILLSLQASMFCSAW